MADIDLYKDVPYHDPELAFLELERRLREECERKISEASENDRVDVFYVDYIGQVLAVARELGLSADFLDGAEEPNIKSTGWEDYLNFRKDVKIYSTKLAIRNARRDHQYSVKLDLAAKQKLRHYLTQIKELVDKLDVEPRKRDALYERIGDLEKEINRERMRFDTFGALAVASAGVAGKVVEKSRIIELLDACAGVIWGAQRDEQAALPPPTETRRIEGPRTPAPLKGISGRKPTTQDLDDEIPF